MQAIWMMLALVLSISGGVSDDPVKSSPPAPTPTPTPTPAPTSPTPVPAQRAPSTPAPDATPSTTDAKKDDSKSASSDPYVLGYTMKDIDGNDVDLAQFKGKVILMVNVASKCGYTPQYVGLEKLFKEKGPKGFVVLGFPANDFGEQEPGSNSDIKTFCSSKYNVTFPMFSKISVRGDEQHALYKQLAAQPKPIGGEPGWNFTKFLIDRNGNVVGRFDSKTKPDDVVLQKKIEELLSQ